jgi:hypothetical protein
MSDLQCPATILLIPSESAGADACWRALEGQRLLGFYVDAAVERDAAIRGLADAADCPVQEIAAVQNGASLTQTLEGLADVHRGETIAVIATAKVIEARLGLDRVPTTPIEIKIDSSGWAVNALRSER